MFSLTHYWTVFEQFVDEFKSINDSNSCQKNIAAAKEMVTLGKSMEKQKEVLDNITAYFPKIKDRFSLLFAVIYYNHLLNYANVMYAEKVWVGQATIEQGIQSDNDDEYSSDSARESSSFLEVVHIINQVPLQPAATIGEIEQQIANYQQRINQLSPQVEEANNKLSNYQEKLSDVNSKNRTYNQYDATWQGYTRFYRWVLKLVNNIYPVAIIRALNQAHESVEQAKEQAHILKPHNITEAKHLSTLKNELSQHSQALLIETQQQEKLDEQLEQAIQDEELSIHSIIYPSSESGDEDYLASGYETESEYSEDFSVDYELNDTSDDEKNPPSCFQTTSNFFQYNQAAIAVGVGVFAVAVKTAIS